MPHSYLFIKHIMKKCIATLIHAPFLSLIKHIKKYFPIIHAPFLSLIKHMKKIHHYPNSCPILVSYQTHYEKMHYYPNSCPILVYYQTHYEKMHYYPNSRPIFIIFAEPIKMLVVEDQFGTEVKGRAGPYNEGTDLQLTCRAVGGKFDGEKESCFKIKRKGKSASFKRGCKLFHTTREELDLTRGYRSTA